MVDESFSFMLLGLKFRLDGHKASLGLCGWAKRGGLVKVYKLSTFIVSAAIIAFLTLPNEAKADTINIASDNETVGWWGPSTGQSYGEIFVAPQPILDDFTLWVSSVGQNGGAIVNFPFVAQVYQFNGATTVGGALYTSATMTTTSTMSAFTFSPNITLTPGAEYIAFVTNEPNGVSLGGRGVGLMEDGINSTGFTFVGSEEAPIERLASVRRTNWTCSFPASSFHEWAFAI